MLRIVGMLKRVSGLATAFLVASLMVFGLARAQSLTDGLIMLIEFEKIEGIRRWEHELDQRGMSALVQAQRNVLEQYPADFARLAAKGYVISGIDAEKAFWDLPYDEQLRRMRETKAAVERPTHNPMRVLQPLFCMLGSYRCLTSHSRRWAPAHCAITVCGREVRPVMNSAPSSTKCWRAGFLI